MNKYIKNMLLRNKGSSITSFALVTRLQMCEMPYLNEFLAYYRNLGVDKFYIINTEPKNRDVIASGIALGFKGFVDLVDIRKDDTLTESPNCVLSRVGETFLLHVDMDEFLYLNGDTLQEFIIQEGMRNKSTATLEYRFQWVMSPLFDELSAPSIRSILEKNYFFPSKTGKSMMRTKDIAEIRTHRFEALGMKTVKKYDPEESNCFVLHVSSRGIFDIINKINFGRFNDVKSSVDPSKELFEFVFDSSSTFLPPRFVLLAFQSKFQSHVVSLDFQFPELEYVTNVERLKSITLNGLEDLLGVEVNDSDMKKVIIDKMNRYPIPLNLVDAYAAKEINLLKVMRRLIG